MKRVTANSYTTDSLFPRVAKAVEDLVKAGLAVSVPDVFVRMGMLPADSLKAWRQGRVPYLERVVMGGLGKTSRIVRIVSLYAHDLGLSVAPPHAAGAIKHAGRDLRFCKTGEPKLEAAYKRVFMPRPAQSRDVSGDPATRSEASGGSRRTSA